jgi:hypothetical protein
MSSHLERLGNKVSVTIPSDESGFTGRECPNKQCKGYFKVRPGTGLHGKNLPCRCPYCGHNGDQDTFWTKAQIKYARSIALQQVLGAFHKDLKQLEFNHPAPRRGFGIGISMTVTQGAMPPIRYYREKRLETEVVCEHCTLTYAIYGVFAFCPDCGAHNSRQILGKNLEVAAKIVALAATVEGDLAEHLVGDALENAVSAFDGFGRELCRVHAAHATNPAQAQSTSFQNLAGAQTNVSTLFGFDMAAGMDMTDWSFAMRCFQKRHLLAHSMGVVDDKYIRATGDPQAVVGRKVVIRAEEVAALIAILRTLGTSLTANIAAVPGSSTP